MITEIDYDGTTGKAGAATLVITLLDLNWGLLDTGFFAMDDEAQLLDIDINYPRPSRFWWRLHQFSPQSDYTIQMTFVPRVVGELMGHFGPLMANRASRTRAEFLAMLCAKPEDPQGIEFYCRELDINQKIAPQQTKSTDSSGKAAAGKASKAPGVGANSGGLKVKGVKPNSTQIGAMNLIIQICQQENAGTTVTQACVFAGICESDLGLALGWDSGNETYGGLLGGSQGNFASLGSSSSDAVWTAQIQSFCNGGRGYNSAKAAQGTYKDIGQLAAHTEGCVLPDGSFGPFGYGQYQAEDPARTILEAQAIVAAGGGGGTVGSSTTSTTKTINKPYYFTVNAGESYWAAMCRLAQEVNWELVIDGNRVYYDADTELIKQKVAGVIKRGSPKVFGWSYDWINRQIVTNFQLQLSMRLFEFCPGEALQVQGFGPASKGSMAKPPLPGVWLISEIQHNGGDLFSTITLVQPTSPLPEPAPQQTTETVPPVNTANVGPYKNSGGSSDPTSAGSAVTPGSVEAAYQAALLLSSMHVPYVYGGGHGVGDLAQKHPTALDCSSSVSWVLNKAGFVIPGCSAPNTAVVSSSYMPNATLDTATGRTQTNPAPGTLQPGAGKWMTIYANAAHVFIHIHPQGLKDMQGNTVNPFHNGFGFFAWNAAGTGGWGGPTPGLDGAPPFTLSHYPGT